MLPAPPLTLLSSLLPSSSTALCHWLHVLRVQPYLSLPPSVPVSFHQHFVHHLFINTNHLGASSVTRLPSLCTNGVQDHLRPHPRCSLTAQASTAVYFASVHLEATKRLALICSEKGQRAYVGKTCMDNPETSADCTETTEMSLENTEALIQYVRQLQPQGLVEPIVTPRFIPSCTPTALSGLGDLAKQYGTAVQTHIAESDWTVDNVRDACPEKRDIAALTSHGLLDGVSILAHAVHVTDEELQEMAHRRLGIAHCPLSNAFYANGIFPAKHALELGVAVGLGTDVGGVYSSSILHSARNAVTSSRILSHGIGVLRGGKPTENATIDAIDAFWMATLGGAHALGKSETLGALGVGRPFDAIVIESGVGDVEIWEEHDTVEDVFQKLVFLSDDRHVKEVYVQGRLVHNKN